MQSVRFDKYDAHGAYHWNECDRGSAQYNPPLAARYKVVAQRIGTANRILDVGCGDGYLMGQVSRRGEHVVGIDPEPAGVALAADMLRRIGNCSVVQASAYALPFGDSCFDVVLLADVLEHLECPDAGLQEIGRVLTPGGVLLLTTPKWRPDRCWDHHHVREYTPEELAHCLQTYFADVSLSFFWPLRWSSMYATRIGWRLIRVFARYFYNPFLDESQTAKDYGQILAVCRRPNR